MANEYDIDIRKPKGKIVRIANNLINSKNEKIIRNVLTMYQKAVENYNTISHEEISKDLDVCLNMLYKLIENTNCKDRVIKNHNVNYKGSSFLAEVCSSTAPIINKGNSIEDSNSNDIVTSDFRKSLKSTTFIDEKIQKVAFWSNKIAHAATDEIKTFTEQYMGPTNSDYEYERASRIFNNRIVKANNKFDDNPEFRFNQSHLLRLIETEEFDINNCTDPDFIKAKDLMREVKLQCKDKSSLRNFIYCNKLQTMNKNFFAFKDNAIDNFQKYMLDERITDDEKNIIAFRVRDNNMKTKDGEGLSRIVLANKTMYEVYLKYNDCINLTKQHIRSYLPQEQDTQQNINKFKSYVKKRFNNRYVDDITMNALMDKCSVSVFHVPDKVLDRYEDRSKLAFNEDFSPIVECMSYNGGHVYDIMPSEEKEKKLEDYLSGQEYINENNKKVYKGRPEKIYSEKSMSSIAFAALKAIDEPNGPGGGNIGK